MALSTTQYGYIIDPMVPFTDGKGKTIKNGFVRVFVAGSSTPVITYRNFDGSANQDLIELDNSGRTKTSVIGSKGLTYKVCVYDKHHSQESPILTVDKVSVIGANITAGTGATVVTGLDGFRTKPDGFVDASVIGTDGYVAIDHTLVEDDLNTDAKATAVEDDRYIPLLNEDVNDPDSKITLKRLKQWIHNDNVVIAGTIYPTLQDAISDATNLSVGDIFETNGFHTNGDGGAARYLVSDIGTANGMDIVQLAAGKLAVLQINQNREMYPEQFGYDRFASQDVAPVFARMAMQNIRNIRLLPCGSTNYPYLMKGGWDVSTPDVSITGYSGLTTGHASRIWFKPDSYNADVTPMFSLTQRGFRMKNVILMNRPWFTEGDKHNCVAIYMATANTNKMWYDFDDVVIQGFDVGIGKLIPSGNSSDGLMWHCEFHRLQMALNNKNVYLKGLSYVTKFDNCFFTVNDSGAQSIAVEESFTVEFDRCNFGIYSPADTILKFNKYVVTGNPVDERWSSAKFTNCNFEIESNASHPLPLSNTGYFAKFDDDDDFHIEFDNCFFISTPLARANIYGCRAFSLGNRTEVKFSNCCGSYEDVNYTGNEFYEWDFQKRMFDGTRPPKKEVGSVIIQHSMGIIAPPNNQWGSIYLPTVKTDEMTCPQCDNDTDFLINYPASKDGLMLMNLDTVGINTKIGNSLVQVVSPQTGKVRIGDRIYDYVVIDGRKWITTNLQLWTMNSRQWHFPEHPEFGFYYGTECFAEIDSLLPTGWRRPNQADCTSLASQGAVSLQKTGFPAWSGATNSTGFSALPSDKWNKPNVTPNFTRVFLWGYEESGVGWHTIFIQSSQVTTGGWTYAEAANRQCNLRVCADA